MKTTTAIYMRISTAQGRQRHDSQRQVILDYLKGQGIRADQVTWYADRESGATLKRPAFVRLMRAMQAGKHHTLLVTRLDRLSRSVRDGLQVLHDLTSRQIRIVAIQQALDLTGAVGALVSTLLLAISQFERDLIRGRIKEGLDAARKNGQRLGRPADDKRNDAIRKMYEARGVQATCSHYGFTRAALYRSLARSKKESTTKAA